jgi:hypothetical protein
MRSRRCSSLATAKRSRGARSRRGAERADYRSLHARRATGHKARVSPIVGRKVFGIASHKQTPGGLRRGPDHRVGQLDAICSPQRHRTVGDLVVEGDDLEAFEKTPGRVDQIGVRSHHHLHPGDDADRPAFKALDFLAGLGDGVEMINEDIGVEKRAYHSRRTFS